jgi:hypothetical protein
VVEMVESQVERDEDGMERGEEEEMSSERMD